VSFNLANVTSLYFMAATWFDFFMAARPTTRKGHRTRMKILEAARAVFARDGYVDARMVDIAEEAGLSTGGLYRYFEDKTDVFAALIADLHEELYEASGHTSSSFASDPLAALMEANRGYMEHYFENRDVMRAFIEAAAVDQRFRSLWWNMRDRHIRRFAKALRATHGVSEIAAVPVELVTEAMACMVEQCCYVWFAHEDMRSQRVSIDDAVSAVSHAWYQAMLGQS
jgi:AcrR family transcriptional regulator